MTAPTTTEVLDLIVAYVDSRGYPPSVGELAADTGAGRATIHRRLEQLEWAGNINREPGRARAITINRKDPL